jgi:Fic family protein
MDIDAFARSPVGRLEPVSFTEPKTGRRSEHVAFVPLPLPDEIRLSPTALTSVADASLSLGRLDGAGGQLPNPSLLVRPIIRKEAVSTSALEGTITGLTEILEAELLEEGATRSPSVREVINYVRAAETGIRLLETRPISLGFICELHRILMAGTRGDSWESGRVRSGQNWIGPRPRSPIEESLYVPPPPGNLLLGGLSEWEKWIHAEHPGMPLLEKVALAHYQFEALHPFRDGNGRIGRLLMILQLIEAGILHHHLLAVSPYLEAHRTDYLRLLRETSQTGDFEPWVRFIGEAVTTEAEAAFARVQALVDFRQETVRYLRQVRRFRAGVALRIAEDLIGFPVVTPTRVKESYGVSYQAANTAIDRLVQAEVLVEITGRTYARSFASPRVLEILEA